MDGMNWKTDKHLFLKASPNLGISYSVLKQKYSDGEIYYVAIVSIKIKTGTTCPANFASLHLHKVLELCETHYVNLTRTHRKEDL